MISRIYVNSYFGIPDKGESVPTYQTILDCNRDTFIAEETFFHNGKNLAVDVAITDSRRINVFFCLYYCLKYFHTRELQDVGDISIILEFLDVSYYRLWYDKEHEIYVDSLDTPPTSFLQRTHWEAAMEKLKKQMNDIRFVPSSIEDMATVLVKYGNIEQRIHATIPIFGYGTEPEQYETLHNDIKRIWDKGDKNER